MCGIAGLLHKKRKVNEQDLILMTDRLAHRGPDGSGFFIQNQVGIAHRRLSIIELEGGKQPLSNEDESIWITFNGEIYNYLELRSLLIKRGHVFATNSDTEVLIHAYEEWGCGFVSKLRGMFAFGIVDLNKKELFLARDHFGIKPLVYGFSESVFCFASEIQALRNVPELDLEMSIKAIDQYLEFLYIPAPDTGYENVKKLPPAHYMRVGFNGVIKEMKQYWRLQFRKADNSLTFNEWSEELESILRESVKAHLVSDVPFGAFLSGGIDSSAVVSFMAKEMTQPIKTFSIGFNEEAFNELNYARVVAEKWQTEHHEEIVVPDALSILPDLVRHYGEPFGDSSAIPTWYVSRLAKKHVTMVLTGDAGDELFAGYESYTSRWSRHLSPIPEHLTNSKKIIYKYLNKLKPGKYPLRTSELHDWLKYIQQYSYDMRVRLWRSDFKPGIRKTNSSFMERIAKENKSLSHFQKAQSYDFNTYLPNDILAKVDIASMMHSLETRTPILDTKVAEFAATIPEKMNISKRHGKWEGKLLLKNIMRNYFPEEFVHRPKQGFAVPLDQWLRFSPKGHNEVKERLLGHGTGITDLFNQNEIEKICNSSYTGQKWQLLFLQEWLTQNK